MAGMPLTGVELFRSRLVVGCLLATVTRNLYWPMHSPGRDDVRLPDRVRGRLWWRPYLNGGQHHGNLATGNGDQNLPVARDGHGRRLTGGNSDRLLIDYVLPTF